MWSVEELEKANIDRSLEARHRIAIAVAQLEAEGAQLSKAAVARRAGSDWRTVAKHSDLLTCSVGVYNGGSGGLLSPGVLLATSGENGFERSSPAQTETKVSETVFVWGLTEIKSCPSGSESVVSRPVSSELGGPGPKDVVEQAEITVATAARESKGLEVAGSSALPSKPKSRIKRRLSVVQTLPERTENKKTTSKNSLQPVSVLVGAGCRGP